MLMEDGSLAAPGLAFASDLDTGFSRSASNKINFSTGGAERLEIGDSEVVFNDPSNDVDFRVESNGNANMLFVDAGNDRVGIGTSSPVTDLELSRTGNNADGLTLTCSDHTNTPRLFFESTSTNGAPVLFGEDGDLRINTGGTPGSSSGTERARIDTSGRLLVGTSSNIGAGGDNRDTIIGVSASGAGLLLGRNDSTVSNGNNIGKIQFWGNDANGTYEQCASIVAEADADHGDGAKPTRLVFSTTASAQSSPTERLRIGSDGMVELRANQGTAETNVIRFTDTDTSVDASQKFGQLQWFSNDASGGGPSVKGEIYVVARDTTPDGDMVFATHDGGGTNTAENIRLISEGGLTFNGDTAVANALNDYEEGTWTPAFGATGGSFTSVTYSLQSGRYTKIGNRVFIECRLQITAHDVGTASGGLLVTGLPYTVNSPTGIGGNVALSNIDIPTSVVNLAVECRENASQFYAGLYTRDNSTFGNITPGNLTSGTVEARASGFYYTNS